MSHQVVRFLRGEAHDPFVFFQDVAGSPPSKTEAYCAAHHASTAILADDLKNDHVAGYSFVTPNLCNDMHGASGCPQSDTIRAGDDWLATNLPPIIDYATTHAGVIFLVWDEGSATLKIPFLAIGPGVKKGEGQSDAVHPRSHPQDARANLRLSHTCRSYRGRTTSQICSRAARFPEIATAASLMPTATQACGDGAPSLCAAASHIAVEDRRHRHVRSLQRAGFLIALHLIGRGKEHGITAKLVTPADTVTSMYGVRITGARPLEWAAEADVVLFGSGKGNREAVKDEAMMARLKIDPQRQLVGSQCVRRASRWHRLGIVGHRPFCTDVSPRGRSSTISV